METKSAVGAQRSSGVLLLLSLVLSSGCLKSSECPCGPGWSQQSCLPEGAICPPEPDAGTDARDAGALDGGGSLHLLVKRSATPLSIDGQLDDAVWNLPLSNPIARLNSGSNNNTSTFGVLWDDLYLYVGVKVLDSDLQHDSAESWLDDSVELYVDGAGEGSPAYDANDRQFTKGWNNAALSTAQSGTGVLHGVANITGGYSVEMAIPWANLGVVPSANMTLGFDVQQNDDDQGGGRDGAMSWNAITADNYRSTVDFGRLTLSSEFASGAGGGGGGTTGGGGGTTGGGGGTTGGGGGTTGGGGGTTGGGGGTTGGGGGTTGGGGAAGGGGATTGVTWEPIPIRTKAQQTAGLPGGEGGQFIYTIAYAPTNPNIAFLGVDTSRVWKSTDGGVSWHPKWRGILSGGVAALAVDPRNENHVLAAVWSGGGWRNTREGIYQTIDGGENWSFVKATTFTHPYTEARGWGGILLAFAGPNVAYAGAHGEGLLKSTNGGNSWSPVQQSGGGVVLAGPARIHDVKAHPTNSAIVYVCNAEGLYRVTDSASGATVMKLGPNLPTSPHAVAVDRRNPNILYVACDGRNNGGIFRSTDGGMTFGLRNTGLSGATDAPAAHLEISQSNPDYLYVTFQKWGNHIYYTTDGGGNWQAPASMDERNVDGWVAGSNWGLDTWGSGIDLNSPIAIHPTNPRIALTTGPVGSHVKKTTDGGANWRYSTSGYLGMTNGFWPSFSDNAAIGWDKSNANRFLYCFGDFGPRLTDNGGSTFTFPTAPVVNGWRECMAAAIDPTPGSNVMVIASGSETAPFARLLRTTNSGASWTDSVGTDDDYRFIAFHSQSPNIVYATGNTSRISTDKGLTWTGMQRRVIAVYAGDGNTVYSTGRGPGGALLIYKSTDRGTSWPTTPLATVPTPSGAAVGQIVVSPNNPDRLYIAARPYGVYIVDGTRVVLKNEAHGLAKGDLGVVGIYVLAIDPRRPNIVYAGSMPGGLSMGNGVFRSTDYGESWSSIIGNLGPDLSIVSLSVNPNNGYIYMGSFAGNWRLPPPP